MTTWPRHPDPPTQAGSTPHDYNADVFSIFGVGVARDVVVGAEEMSVTLPERST